MLLSDLVFNFRTSAVDTEAKPAVVVEAAAAVVVAAVVVVEAAVAAADKEAMLLTKIFAHES